MNDDTREAISLWLTLGVQIILVAMGWYFAYQAMEAADGRLDRRHVPSAHGPVWTYEDESYDLNERARASRNSPEYWHQATVVSRRPLRHLDKQTKARHQGGSHRSHDAPTSWDHVVYEKRVSFRLTARRTGFDDAVH